MLVKPLQPENALLPILVTLFGIVMLIKPLQPENASSPILVILSGMSDDELNIYLQKERLIPYTINTITDPMELKKHIQRIREDGFAETISEYEQDIHSLGCPIFDHEGHIIASVSINWPLFREEPGKREKCLQGIKKVAAMASSLMGYKDTKLVETI